MLCFQMYATLTMRRILKSIVTLCIPLVLAVVAVPLAPAQATNMAAPAPADVLEFPSLDRLPGNVPPRVWNGLGKVWARLHARWQLTASNDVGAVVFLGDSITEGWSTLAKDFPNLKVANRGIGGDITSGVLYRLKADVLSLNPSGIVLLIGTNDVGDGSDAKAVAENIRSILAAIKEFNPNLKVIVCKIMPRSDGGGPTHAKEIKEINVLVEQYISGEPNFTICDTWSIYADDEGAPNPDDFNPDHLHLNQAGYRVWKAALDPVIAKQNWSVAKAQ